MFPPVIVEECQKVTPWMLARGFSSSCLWILPGTRNATRVGSLLTCTEYVLGLWRPGNATTDSRCTTSAADSSRGCLVAHAVLRSYRRNECQST